MNKHLENGTRQPVAVDRHTKKEPTFKERNLTANLGDVIADKPQTIQEM